MPLGILISAHSKFHRDQLRQILKGQVQDREPEPTDIQQNPKDKEPQAISTHEEWYKETDSTFNSP